MSLEGLIRNYFGVHACVTLIDSCYICTCDDVFIINVCCEFSVVYTPVVSYVTLDPTDD